MFWKRNDQGEAPALTTIYVVDFYYADGRYISALLTGLYVTIGDGREVDADLIEIGRNADEIHRVVGFDLSLPNSLKVLNRLSYEYEAGLVTYIDEADLRAVVIRAAVQENLGKGAENDG